MWNIQEMKKELKTLMGFATDKEFEEFLAVERALPLQERFSFFHNTKYADINAQKRSDISARLMELLQKIFLVERSQTKSLDELPILYNKFKSAGEKTEVKYDKNGDREKIDDGCFKRNSAKDLIHNLRLTGLDSQFKSAIDNWINYKEYKAEKLQPHSKHYTAYIQSDYYKDLYLLGIEILLAEQKFGIDNNYTLEQYIADRNAAKKASFLQKEAEKGKRLRTAKTIVTGKDER